MVTKYCLRLKQRTICSELSKLNHIYDLQVTSRFICWQARQIMINWSKWLSWAFLLSNLYNTDHILQDTNSIHYDSQLMDGGNLAKHRLIYSKIMWKYSVLMQQTQNLICRFNIKTIFVCVGIPIIMIRQSWDQIIFIIPIRCHTNIMELFNFIMGIPILITSYFVQTLQDHHIFVMGIPTLTRTYRNSAWISVFWW